MDKYLFPDLQPGVVERRHGGDDRPQQDRLLQDQVGLGPLLRQPGRGGEHLHHQQRGHRGRHRVINHRNGPSQVQRQEHGRGQSNREDQEAETQEGTEGGGR